MKIPLEEAVNNWKPTCYKCGDPIEVEDYMEAPILESPKDAGCPPKAQFHWECYKKYTFDEGGE